MADRYVFSDEAGNFDFSRGSGASRYFILGTVTADDCRIGDELLQLRRDLGWRGVHLDKVFHATEDPQAVRDEVFDVLSHGNFRIDATILEKSNLQSWHEEEAGNVSRSCRRSRRTSLSVRVPPRCLLARRKRSLPPSRRLLRLGDPEEMGARRLALLRADQGQDQLGVRCVVDRTDPLLLERTWPPDS
jgi:hypothetical protein